MAKDRIDRLNSLLKEVIAEVVHRHVRHPHLHELTTITRVEISKDLHHAKVYVSVIADEKGRKETIEALQSASGFIAVNSSKLVKIRFFPQLRFLLDDSADKHMRIDSLLRQIDQERPASSPEEEISPSTDETPSP